MSTADTMPPRTPVAHPGDVGWLRAFFGDSPDFLAAVDIHGNVLASNRPAPPQWANATAGYPYAGFFGSDGAAQIQAALQRAVSTRQAVRLETAGPREDGSRGWCLLSITPVLRGDQVTALVASAIDITDRQREEQRLRRSESLLVDAQGVAHLGTWEWEIALPHATWSQEMYRIYGLDPKSHVPTYEDYLTRVHPADRQRVAEATSRVFHELQPYSHDERIFRSDGGMRYLHTWAFPVVDGSGKLIRLMGVCQDITDRKLAENALAEHAAALARSNADLEQFAHVAAHDLQEPLRTVTSYVQLLSQRLRGQLDEPTGRAIGFILQGVRRMKAQIDSLLRYSQVSTGRDLMQPVPLVTAADQVIADLEATISEAGATVHHGALPTVFADPVQIYSLLQNLIVNAIHYRGPEAPRIEISAKPADDKVEVIVRDNGVGIAPEHRDRIFTVFQRLSADKTGTGIGLAICKKIVESHGGRIWVEDAPGQGAEFHFTLPGVAGGLTASA